MNNTYRATSSAEELFASIWEMIGPNGYQLERELRFAPPRRWRFDFAMPQHRLAIEIEGVTHGRPGRHQRAAGYAADCEKYNAAAELGWRVLRYTPADLRRRPYDVIEQIQRTIEAIEAEITSQ